MKRIIELLKSILLVILSCSLVALAVAAMPADTIRSSPVLSWLMQPLAPLLGLTEAELAYVEAAPTVIDAAKPVAVSVQSSAGRCTVMWNFDQLDSAYESLGSSLGQALDTAGDFAPATQEELRQALTQSSVAFCYHGSLPAPVLAHWLGAELNEDTDTSWCILAVEDGAVGLYLVGSQALRASTLLDAGTLEALLESFRPDGSAFGFETRLGVSDLSLIPGEDPALPGGRAVNPCTTRTINDIATTLGFNPYGDSRYLDDQGSTHFSEANLSLQITADGLVQLTSSDTNRFQAADGSKHALIETARQLITLVADDRVGDGRLYLSGITAEDEETVCRFSYLVSGLPVAMEQSAATVRFQGQSVTEMKLLLRRFLPDESTCAPLPVAQAAAILPGGGTLQLQYRITADGLLDVGWKK